MSPTVLPRVCQRRVRADAAAQGHRNVVPRELVPIVYSEWRRLWCFSAICPQSPSVFRPHRITVSRARRRSRPDDEAAPYDRGRMRPITVTRTVDAPREQVFGYLSDIANHAEFSDHYLHDSGWSGSSPGAWERPPATGSTFRSAAQWGDAVITGLEAPHRVVLEGRTGRIGRIGPGGVPPHAGRPRDDARRVPVRDRAGHAVRPAEGVARPARLAAPSRPAGARPAGGRAARRGSPSAATRVTTGGSDRLPRS